MCKSNFFWKFLGASRKKQRCCFFRGVYKVSQFLIAYFNLLLATHIPDKKKKISGNFWCTTEYITFGAPCIYHFQSRKCFESCLLIFIWLCKYSRSWFDISCPNSMYKTYICPWILGAPRKLHRHFSFCGAPYI